MMCTEFSHLFKVSRTILSIICGSQSKYNFPLFVKDENELVGKRKVSEGIALRKGKHFFCEAFVLVVYVGARMFNEL